MAGVVKTETEHGPHDHEAEKEADDQSIICMGPCKIKKQPTKNYEYQTVCQAVPGRTLEILKGNGKSVASGLRRAATRRGLDAKERIPSDTAANYIEKNQKRLRYEDALSKGLPIATGVIEGACRHLVKDRMDLTGARWRLKSADAVLKLRALKTSGDLKKYLSFHFWKERCRNYIWMPNCDAVPAMI